MRYGRDDEESKNVEDRRGQGGGIFGGGGMFGGRRGRRIRIPMGRGRSVGGGGFSITTLLIIGAVMLFMGINPLDILRGGLGGGGGIPQMPRLDPGAGRTGGGQPRPASQRTTPFDIPGMPGANRPPASRNSTGKPSSGDDWGVFTKRVLKDTEDVWTNAFANFNKSYRKPTLVLYTDRTTTGCGLGQAAMGPFYCPLDEKIYVDLQFYNELQRQFRAPGDFAQAYVIAHEVGHHVQKLLGIATRVQSLKQRLGKRKANALQVKMELQADCLAGVWASKLHQSKARLETGDIEEGLRAARAIGDDMIQRRTMGRVVPHAFTHGSSEQRERWFRRGLKAGQMKVCDTFQASRL